MGPVKITWEPVRREESRRLKHAGWIFCIFLLLALARAFQVQVLKIQAVKAKMPIYNERIVLPAKRGLIYDRNMNILAMDVPVFSSAIDPSVIKHPARVVEQLAEVLGGNPADYQTLIEQNRHFQFVWLKRDLTQSEKDGLEGLDIRGVIIREERKRAHPCPLIACAVLGGINAEYQGVGGIEQSMDPLLRGEEGWEILQKDGKNRNYSSPDYPMNPPRKGQNIVLTLDQVGQTIVEEELERGVTAYRAKEGTAILMDPTTGEILAMASILDRPEAPTEYKSDYFVQNRAVQVEFEPGSTLKVVTAAAALEEGIHDPNSIIHCENGAYRLSGQVIHDHDKKYDYLTLSQVIQYSSNIGIAKISKKLGKKTLFRYMQNFGFGTSTGIELPGEAAGTLWPVYKWNDFSTATIAFGQGISVTTLQLACMTAVIANGGYLAKPRLVHSLVDENGNTLKSYNKEFIRRVLSERTALQMRDILEKTVNHGNAGEASVTGIRIAGKTGTAQKSIAGTSQYAPGIYTSSFAGFWPVESPRFVLVVVLEEPKGLYYAAQTCAPIFANVVKRIFGLPSSPIFPKREDRTGPANRSFVFSDYQTQSDLSETVPEGTVLADEDPFRVPKLTGLSLREALQKLASREIEARVEGSGAVCEQTPKAGEKITPGLVCRLVCR